MEASFSSLAGGSYLASLEKIWGVLIKSADQQGGADG